MRLPVLSLALACTLRTAAIAETEGLPVPTEPWQQRVVRQAEDTTCAAAALANILRFQMGIEIAEADIVSDMLGERSLQDIRRNGGFSLGDVLGFVEGLGLSGRGERGLGLGALGDRLPAIVQTTTEGDAHHFVVVLRREGDRFAVADPATGGRWMTASELATLWTGIVFVVLSP